MALNPGRVGHEYPVYRYEVAREKIREYATAVGEDDSRYYSDGDDAVAPPTFAAVFTITRGLELVVGDPELGAHPGLVHGSQSYEFGERPLRPGDVLTCTPRITSITERAGNDFLTVEVDCRFAEDASRAVLSQTTLVFLAAAAEAAPAAGPGASR